MKSVMRSVKYRRSLVKPKNGELNLAVDRANFTHIARAYDFAPVFWKGILRVNSNVFGNV